MIRIIITLLVFPFFVFAQSDVELLRSCVVDSGGSPVVDAHVSLRGATDLGTVTAEDGCFQLAVLDWPITLIITHVNYKPFEIILHQATDLPTVVVLTSAVRSLPDVTVNADVIVDTVYAAPYSITDYVFHKGHLILLACKNNIEGYSLILLDADGREQADFSLREVRPKQLFQTCDHRLYLLTGANVKEILLQDGTLSFGRNIPREDFRDDLEDCVLVNDSLAYFQRYFYQGQALQYSALRRFTDLRKEWKLPLIENDRNMVLLVEETGNKMPWSGNLWEENISGRLRILRDSRYHLAGIMKIFYPPIYAPLFPKDSTLCVFNHFASEIQYFTPEARLLYTVPINYHLKKKWRKKIYFDPLEQAAYTAFDTHTGVKIFSINLQTGQLEGGVEIPRDFIEKVKVWNGHVYFLYCNRGKREWNRKLQRVRL